MLANTPLQKKFSRRDLAIGVALLFLQAAAGKQASAAETDAIADRFDFLSKHGNSECSVAFMKSIATMPVTARLQGSCCSPMELKRHREQLRGLAKYIDIPEIPSDPYDIAAGNSQKVMPYFDISLTEDEQASYQYAMDHSEEKGPCCCRCWRWTVYGGLAKFLIREHRFTGEQVTEVWDLSDGCGGD
jgi:hypothetical protein